MIRNVLWLGGWFVIMWQPYRWAQAAASANKRAERAEPHLIWDDTFEQAFEDGWRLLVAFLLLSVFALARSAITRALSLRFHHTNHFAQMQVLRLFPPCLTCSIFLANVSSLLLYYSSGSQ